MELANQLVQGLKNVYDTSLDATLLPSKLSISVVLWLVL